MIMYENLNMISCGNVNCYVIRGKRGDVLIDTGFEKYRDYIETWLLNYKIKLIILTHGHVDHIQNAEYFSRLCSAPVMMSSGDIPLSRDNSCRHKYITTLSGYLLEAAKTKNISADPFDVTYPVTGEMSLSEYGIDGRIISLEGHTRGSLGVLCKSSVGYDLYAGDAVFNSPFPMFPMTAESPRRARESIEKIIGLAPDRILPGHGKPIVCGTRAYQMFIGRF